MVRRFILAATGICIALSTQVQATLISAEAVGSNTPGVVQGPGSITNGDFVISSGLSWPVGDARDEFNDWVFRLGNDAEFAAFASEAGSSRIVSALLTLTFRTNANLVTDDEMRFGGLSAPMANLGIVNMPGIVQTRTWNLLDYYSGESIYAATLASGGAWSVRYHDDALVSRASIAIETAPVPEPATVSLLAMASVMLGAVAWKRRRN